MWKKAEDVTICLPTGGVKSACYEVVAKFTHPDRIALLIIPYRAIIRQAITKCKAMGLNLVEYVPSGFLLPKKNGLVVVSSERVKSKDFQE